MITSASITRACLRVLLPCAISVACVATSSPGQRAQAASSDTLDVTFSVSSATSLSPAACPPAARSIGVVPPGTTSRTLIDCTIEFGSSNDTSRLRVWQADGSGQAMFRWTSGVADAGFGPAGVRTVAPPGGGAGADGSQTRGGMASAADGDLLKGGTVAGEMAVGRWNLDGSLDSGGWGTAGYATADASDDLTGGTGSEGADVLALRSGKVLVAGSATNGSGDYPALVRFTSTGIADITYGGGDGIFVFEDSMFDGRSVRYLNALELPDGSTIVAGSTSNDTFFAIKVTAAGELDEAGFGGGDGLWTRTNGSFVYGVFPILADDGRIVLVGSLNGDPFVARLTRQGVLDTTFGNGDGWENDAVTGNHYVRSGGFIDDAGNIYAVGDASCNSVTISRMTPTGDLDLAWGVNGLRSHGAIGTGGECGDFGDVVELGDGRFCAGGDYDTAGWSYWVGCFEADGTWDTDFGGGDGWVSFAAGDVESHGGGLTSSNGRLYAGGDQTSFVLMVTGEDDLEVPDYAHPATNFGTAGGAFGICLRDLANATDTWTPAPGGDCSADGAHWHGVPAFTAAAAAEVATAAATVDDAQVMLQFGVTVPNGARGTLHAPLMFEVLAP